jgi:hypothetical protein
MFRFSVFVWNGSRFFRFCMERKPFFPFLYGTEAVFSVSVCNGSRFSVFRFIYFQNQGVTALLRPFEISEIFGDTFEKK